MNAQPETHAPVRIGYDLLIVQARGLQDAADSIGAMMTGVELMLDQLRGILHQAGGADQVEGSDLWKCCVTLAANARERATSIAAIGEKIEREA